jgi:glycosyltransferase involved in cell wall biosynthesis
MKNQNLPKISFITPMKEKDFRVIKLLESIKKQDYPLDKIELIITDGGSNPEVLEECKKYSFVKIYPNLKQLAEGAGMGKDQGIWKSSGEFIVIAESDIELIEEKWIRNMIKPLIEDKEIFASVPRLYVNPNDNLTNRYLSYVGVDPFASNRSIEGQLELNKKIFEVSKRAKDFFVLKLDKELPYCMGSNGFMFRRSLIKDVGDYAQDLEFIARLAKKGYERFAVVENARVWHKNVKGFRDFMRKRLKWTKNYSLVYVKEKKDFRWIESKPKFFAYAFKNMIIVPNIPISIRKAVYYKDFAWLLHPLFMFISTGLNIYFTLFSKAMLKQVFGN